MKTTMLLFVGILVINCAYTAETGRGHLGRRGSERVTRMTGSGRPENMEEWRKQRLKEIAEEQKKEAQDEILAKLKGMKLSMQQRIAYIVKARRAKGERVPYVICSTYNVWHVRKNVELEQYRNEVRFQLSFTNLTGYEVAGLKYTVKFIDAFGEVLHEGVTKDPVKIHPWDVYSHEIEGIHYTIKDNMFSDDEPYDKIWGGVHVGTVKLAVSISQIAWANRRVTGNLPPEKTVEKQPPPKSEKK